MNVAEKPIRLFIGGEPFQLPGYLKREGEVFRPLPMGGLRQLAFPFVYLLIGSNTTMERRASWILASELQALKTWVSMRKPMGANRS